MGRLGPDIVARAERFSHRVLDVVDALADQSRSRRVLDQLMGSGTAVGANVFEADEAMSRADFCKSLAVTCKELNETRFWLRLVVAREWLPGHRLSELETECLELKRIFGSMLARTKRRDKDRV